MTGKNPKLLGNNLQLSDEELKLVAGGNDGEPMRMPSQITCLSCGWTTGWNNLWITKAKQFEHQDLNPTHTEYKTESYTVVG